MSLETLVASTREDVTAFKRLPAVVFFTKFLHPLEHAEMCKFMRTTKQLPFFIGLCGDPMSNIPLKNRNQILKRFLVALKIQGVSFTLDSVKAMLTVFLQNEHFFDPLKMLSDVEGKLAVKPDVAFFNLCFWNSARNGQFSLVKPLLEKMKQRGIQPDHELRLLHIFYTEMQGGQGGQSDNPLIDDFVAKYGSSLQSARSLAIGAAIQGASTCLNLDRLRLLLASAEVCIDRPSAKKVSANDGLMAQSADEELQKVLDIPADVIFDVIWKLAKASKTPYGREYAQLINEILVRSAHTEGFFKLTVRESDRHIVHNYLYSALALLQFTNTMRIEMEKSFALAYQKSQLCRLLGQCIAAGIEHSVIKDVADRITAIFGERVRVWDQIFLRLLTFKEISVDQQFDFLSHFVDLIDPRRERLHLLLPLLSRPNFNLLNRCKMVSKFASLGYANISLADNHLLCRYLVTPALEHFASDNSNENILDRVQQFLEQNGINKQNFWQIMKDYIRREESSVLGSDSKFLLPIDRDVVRRWLKTNLDEKEELMIAFQLDAMTFKELVFKKKSVQLTHEFLKKCGGFSDHVELSAFSKPVLNLYLEQASLGQLEELVAWMSGSVSGSSMAFNSVPNYIFIEMLRRKCDEILQEKQGQISILNEYLLKLKGLYPEMGENAELEPSETMSACCQLFYSLFSFHAKKPIQNVGKYIHEGIQLLGNLLRYNLIKLRKDETVTPLIVRRVMFGFGWKTALETLVSIQNNFHCTNGTIDLLAASYNLGIPDSDRAVLLHKSQAYVSPKQLRMFHIAALILAGRTKEAEGLFRREDISLDPLDSLRIIRQVKSALHIYAVANESEEQIQPYINFLRIFPKYILSYTNIEKNEDICARFADALIKNFEDYGSLLPAANMQIEMYQLFTDHKIKLNRMQLNIIREHLQSGKETCLNFVRSQQNHIDLKTNVENFVNNDAFGNIRTIYGKIENILKEIEEKVFDESDVEQSMIARIKTSPKFLQTHFEERMLKLNLYYNNNKIVGGIEEEEELTFMGNDKEKEEKADNALAPSKSEEDMELLEGLDNAEDYADPDEEENGVAPVHDGVAIR